jgi:hypothetical protein
MSAFTCHHWGVIKLSLVIQRAAVSGLSYLLNVNRGGSKEVFGAIVVQKGGGQQQGPRCL